MISIKPKTCLNYSGGKDSTAMLLKLIELGERPDKIVFADTLMEFPEMYDFIDHVEDNIGQRIIRTKPNNTYLSWFYGRWSKGKRAGEIRGSPSTLFPCWFQREAKVKPLEREGKGYVKIIGFSASEKHRVLSGSEYRYPLIEWGWSGDYCRTYCEMAGMLNPLYDIFKRLGCWCCPKQPKKNMLIIMRKYPALWKIILQLNEDSPYGFSAKYDVGKINSERQAVLCPNSK